MRVWGSYIYADDIILLSKGRVQHQRLLQTVFKLFAENGIKLSINKCSSYIDNYCWDLILESQ